MDTGKFEEVIKYLSNHYTFVSIHEALRILEGTMQARKPLLITFDDGYMDNYTDAFPILKKYSVPAIIFLATDFVDGKMWIWQVKRENITPLWYQRYQTCTLII